MAKLNKKNKEKHKVSDLYVKKPKVKSLTAEERAQVKAAKKISRGARARQLYTEREARIKARRDEEKSVGALTHGLTAYSQKRFRRIIGGGRIKRLKEKIAENRAIKSAVTGVDREGQSLLGARIGRRGENIKAWLKAINKKRKLKKEDRKVNKADKKLKRINQKNTNINLNPPSTFEEAIK